MKHLRLTALGLLLTAMSVWAFGQPQKAGEKPNILFIVVDDLKPVLGCYGNSDVQTPGIDKLAASGVVFENSYCQQAVCAPSRISAFTGKRPDRTKVYDLKTNMRDMNPDIVTLPQFFKANGYQTAGLGKLMHGAKQNDPRSWTIPYKEDKHLTYARGYEYPADGKYQNPDIQEAVKEAKKLGLKGRGIKKYLKERDLFPSVEHMEVPDDAYTDGAIAENGMKLMEKLAKSDKPFFLALGFHRPHLPFSAPQKYWDFYDGDTIKINPFQEHAENSPDFAYTNWGELRNYSDIPAKGNLTAEKQKELIHGYWAAASYSDAQVEKVLKKLEELDIRDNTIIVLWGDHGWHLGDHGQWCKHTNFEQATKAPLIISTPGCAKGEKAGTMAEFVDIFPTLVEYAGYEVPEYLEGKSLLPVLENTGIQIKDYAISQYFRGRDMMGYTIRTKRYRLTLWLKGDYKHSEVFRNPEIAAMELYDYQTDPQERVSLAEDPAYAQTVEELKAKLLGLLNEQADKFDR